MKGIWRFDYGKWHWFEKVVFPNHAVCGSPMREGDYDLKTEIADSINEINHAYAVCSECIAKSEKAKHKEMVDHPEHYGGDVVYEAKKIIRYHKLNFNLGSALKYIIRAGVKDPKKHIQDLEKAKWYIDDEIRFLKTGDL